jgi:hypothetical protein
MGNLAASHFAPGMHHEALQFQFFSTKASFLLCSSKLIAMPSSSPEHQALSCDLMFRFLCAISLAEDRDFARLQLLQFFREALQPGLLVKNGRARCVVVGAVPPCAGDLCDAS